MTIWKMSISLSFLILWVLAVRFFGKKRLNKTSIVVLWNLVLLRALLPLHISIEKIPFMNNQIKDIMRTGTIPGKPGLKHAVSMPSGQIFLRPDGLKQDYIFAVWLIGMAVVCLIMIFRSLSEFCAMRESVPIQCRQAEELMEEAGLYRKIRICCGKSFRTPVTCGFLRPRIIFPEDFDKESQDDLKNMIRHELVHIRRFDVLKRLGMLAAVCLHWFNPLIWVCFRFYKEDQEMACDELVLRTLNCEAAKAYASTLIHMSMLREKETIFMEGFQKRKMERERLLAAIENRKMGIGGTIAAVLLTASSLISFASYSPVMERRQIPTMQNREAIQEAEWVYDRPESKEPEEERMGESEYYEEILKDIEENYNDYSKPLTEKQMEAVHYRNKIQRAEIFLRQLEQGKALNEEAMKIIEEVYPEKSYLNRN